ncbi:MAG: flagellin [Acidobacteria bacterium]|nr:flagellin [Acidobacteriota bacterium]
MSLGVLNNISAIYAQTNLNRTQASLQNTLTQLSSGSRINSGADDAAGLALADGLHANVAALTQSAQNASAGVGLLQTADGALSQVTNLLNRAITLATQAANGTLNTNQVSSADQEYQNILTEIANIGSTTNYNGQAVFSATPVTVFVSDGTASGASTFSEKVGILTKASVGTTSAGAGADLTTNAALTAATATAILTSLTSAVQDVAYQRGTLGANINQLNAAANVANTQSVNLSDAENNVRATNFGQATSDMAKYKVLSQTGIAALSQANAVQQDVLKLLQ